MKEYESLIISFEERDKPVYYKRDNKLDTQIKIVKKEAYNLLLNTGASIEYINTIIK